MFFIKLIDHNLYNLKTNFRAHANKHQQQRMFHLSALWEVYWLKGFTISWEVPNIYRFQECIVKGFIQTLLSL